MLYFINKIKLLIMKEQTKCNYCNGNHRIIISNKITIYGKEIIYKDCECKSKQSKK